MNRAPWWKFDAGDWLGNRGIRFLTAEQRGYLIQLRAEAWESEERGTIPEDPELLWKLAGATSREAFESTSAPVLALFKRKSGRLRCPELLEQAGELTKLASLRSKAGRASGKARKRKQELVTNTCSTDVQQVSTEEKRSRSEREEILNGNSNSKPTQLKTKDELQQQPQGKLRNSGATLGMSDGLNCYHCGQSRERCKCLNANPVH